ncbi:group II intron maturase-specific domain-containing protein [Embleya sp. NBC_00888]|uniref:group II intron maturase-specific domain-containing protein n=1 Tax=Embleya sp. NBC_00888 TaxID=2975960 RepID=UPI002F919AD9
MEFTFLGFTFRPRSAKNKNGVQFTSFLPAISKEALKKLSGNVRSWRLHRRSGSTESDLARVINPMIRGWMNYYGRYYRSALNPLFYRINTYLLRWIRRKYRLGWKQAVRRLAHGHALRPKYFAHWAWTKPGPG